MDFQKMVRQFRENVVDESKPQPINEMASKYYRAAAEERVGDLEDGRQTPRCLGDPCSQKQQRAQTSQPQMAEQLV